jgi:hypothetical protein
MSTRDLAVKLAAIKAVKDALGKAEAITKVHLEEALDPGDRKDARLGPDDPSLGTITYSKTSAKAVVTDRAAFTAWATNAYPTEVRVPVTLDADDMLAAINYARGAGQFHDAHHRVFAAIRAAEPVVNGAWETQLLAKVVKAKAAVDTTTGEEIPGVTYVPGGSAGYVAIRQSEEQRDALIEAWTEGRIDLLHEVITAPAIVATA